MTFTKNKQIGGVFALPAVTMIIYGAYLNFEPAMAVGAGTISDSITVTQSVTSEITISSPIDVTMSPSIAGITGGTGNGSATWNVRTNDTSGFNLKIKASASPALQSGSYSFVDYTEASASTPDFAWSIAASDSEFGYTVESTTVEDTAQAFKDNGTVCGGTGTVNAVDTCWDGLSTTDATIVNRSNITSSTGENETVKFRAQSGSSRFQEEGAYTATITVTATTN